MAEMTDACRCGHWLASHMPIGDGTRAACYDPADVCPCRRFDADLPWRTK